MIRQLPNYPRHLAELQGELRPFLIHVKTIYNQLIRYVVTLSETIGGRREHDLREALAASMESSLIDLIAQPPPQLQDARQYIDQDAISEECFIRLGLIEIESLLEAGQELDGISGFIYNQVLIAYLERLLRDVESRISGTNQFDANQTTSIPVWDSLSLTLSYKNVICLEMRKGSTHQTRLLDKFEAGRWQKSVQNTRESRTELRETVKNLNRTLRRRGSQVKFGVKN